MCGKAEFLLEEMKAAVRHFVESHEQLSKLPSASQAEASVQLTKLRRGKNWTGRTAAYNDGNLCVYLIVEHVVTDPSTTDGQESLFSTDELRN